MAENHTGQAGFSLSRSESGSGHPYAQISGHVIWSLQVDWDGDGVFDTQLEPQNIRSLKIRRGRCGRMRADGLGQVQPGAEGFEIELIDVEGRYDSFNSSSPVYGSLGAPALLLRVLIVSGSGTEAAQPVFVGTLTGVHYDSVSAVARLSGVGLSDYLEVGSAAALFSPVQSVPYDSCFVWNGSTPVPFNYWSGRPGGLTLSACAGIVLSLAGWPLGVNYGSLRSPEQPRFFFMDGESGWQVLKELADGFAARLFFLRDGCLYVMDRCDRVGTGSDLDAPQRAQLATGLVRESPFATLRNSIEVKVRPQAVVMYYSPFANSRYSPVWYNGGPLELAAGESLLIDIRYPDGLGKPSQGSFARTNTDYVIPDNPLFNAWTQPDRSGTRLDGAYGSGQVTYNVISPTLGSAPGTTLYQKFCRVQLVNAHPTAKAYCFDLAVLLAGVTEVGQALAVIREDLPSQQINGKRTMQIDSRWIQDAGMAGTIGEAYLEALSTRETASVATITYQWSGDVLLDHLVTYDLGRFVDFGAAGSAGALANFGLWGRRLIVGQELRWMSADGQAALVSLSFEKAPPRKAAVSGSGSSAAGLAVSSLSWTHVVPAGEARMLLVSVSRRAGGVSVSAVSCGSQALSCLGSAQAGSGAGYPAVEMWVLMDPLVGSHVLTISLTGAEFVEAGAVNCVNVHPTTPYGAPVSAHGTAGVSSVSLTGTENDVFVDVLGFYSGSSASVGSGQLQRWSATSDLNWRGAGSSKPGSLSTALGWVSPGTWVQLALRVNGIG